MRCHLISALQITGRKRLRIDISVSLGIADKYCFVHVFKACVRYSVVFELSHFCCVCKKAQVIFLLHYVKIYSYIGCLSL